MTTSKLLASALALLALASVACGGQTHDETPLDAPPAAEPMSSQGLTITSRTADRVEGTFSRHDQTLSFELSTTEAGHLARILDHAGSPLVETTFEGGIEDTSLLGGKARLRGPVDADKPEMEGDESIFQEMSAVPETRLIAELKEALRVEGVDEAFFSAMAGEQAAPGAKPGLTTRKWLDVWGKWHLSCSEFNDFPTWTFWGVTTIELRPEYSTSSAALRVLTPWYNPTEYTGMFSGTIVVRRQYAGYQVRVSNNVAALNGSCGSPLLVKVY